MRKKKKREASSNISFIQGIGYLAILCLGFLKHNRENLCTNLTGCRDAVNLRHVELFGPGALESTTSSLEDTALNSTIAFVRM